MKSKEKRINIAIIDISIIILISIFIMTIYISKKVTYASDISQEKKINNVKISNAQTIDIDKIIENNTKKSGYKEEIIVVEEELEYITKYRNNDELYKGTTLVSQEGRNGTQNLTFKRIYDEEGNLVEEKQISAVVTKSSINKIIDIGTKIYVEPKVETQTGNTTSSSTLNRQIALNKPSGFSQEEFKKVLTDSKDVNNIFKNNSEYFYYIEKEYNINGIFVASVGIHESAWGTSKIAKTKYNLFGYGAYDSNPYNGAYQFSSYSESIDLIARVFVKYYINPKGTKIYDGQVASGKYYNGNTIDAVNKKYATDKNWGNCVYKYMEYLYGKK